MGQLAAGRPHCIVHVRSPPMNRRCPAQTVRMVVS
jgi:hypothetical protein